MNLLYGEILKKLMMLLIVIPAVVFGQKEKNIDENKTGLQKWQYSFVTNLYLTTMAINKPYNINLLEGYETQIINGVNIFFSGGEIGNGASSFFEYDLLFRINKYFTENYFIGIEAGPCLRSMIRNGSERDDGMNLKFGAETGYSVAENIHVIFKIAALVTAQYENASAFGIGFKYSF